MTEIRTVNTLELKLDWALCPRYEANTLDRTNVKRLMEAIEAGEVLPPITADKKSYRVVDGFHRLSAYNSLSKDGLEVPVELRSYKNDTEMFFEAARLNTIHGLPLSPKDKVHVILTARRKRIPLAKVAAILGMSKDRVKQLEEKRTAQTSSGEKIPLAAGAMGLAGKKLTAKQEKFARTSNGILPVVNARLLINALNASAVPLTESEVKVLRELRDAINLALSNYEEVIAE